MLNSLQNFLFTSAFAEDIKEGIQENSTKLFM